MLLSRAGEMVRLLFLPPDYLYSDRHLWVSREPGRRFSLVGATEVMTWRLRSIDEVSISPQIVQAHRGEIVGEIAGTSALGGTRSTVPITSPLTGMINPVNERLLRRRRLRRAQSDLVRIDPYDSGWVMAILGESEQEFDALLDAEGYRRQLLDVVGRDPAALSRFEATELAAATAAVSSAAARTPAGWAASSSPIDEPTPAPGPPSWRSESSDTTDRRASTSTSPAIDPGRTTAA